MICRFNEILPADYRALAQNCNKRISELSANRAIQNSIFTVGIYDEETLVAFGRICGDGALYFMVCDVMVDPQFEEQHLELQILKELNDYLRETLRRESSAAIHVDAKYAEVCRQFGFKYLDEDYEVVMKR